MASLTQLAVWVVRYCKQLWAAVGGKYGEVEAGQVLGHHFSEVCQVGRESVAAGHGSLRPGGVDADAAVCVMSQAL